jgi:hypothetical protein
VRPVVALLAAASVAGAIVVLGLVGEATRHSQVGEAVALGPPRFVEVAAAAGLSHLYQGRFTYIVGGGVAVMDCDDDGKPDLYLAGGSAPAALYRNVSDIGGALRFARVADPAAELSAVTGAYPLDVDGDGRVDLAALRVGENVLLRGTGECHFRRANEEWGFDGGNAWTTAFSATWETGARLPTLAFGNYLDLERDSLGLIPGATPDYTCTDGALIRPDPGGARFARPVPLSPAWCTLSMLFSDWSRTGRRDLRVSNDRHYYSDTSDGEEQLWRMDPGRPPRLYTHDDGWQTVRIWGMGIASQDLTGDGLPEVFLTSQGDNKLQTLANGPAAPTYRDIALRLGVTATRPFAGGDIRPSTAWHAEFDDVNNDGFEDLFVAKGNVDSIPDYALRDPSNLLLGKADGTFVESAADAGILSYARGRGAALADFNLDGLLDLVEVNREHRAGLWRNVGNARAGESAGAGGSVAPVEPAAMGNWLGLRLRQSGANADAIGSWVEVKTAERSTVRELTVGGGHAGGQLGWIHFGLGTASSAEVRVQWPDGETGPWLQLTANQFAIVERGASQARTWNPGPG